MEQDNSYNGWAKAFEIFAKYESGTFGAVAAGHEEIFAGPNPDLVSEEDKAELAKYGWQPCDFDCFRRYV